MKLINSFMKSYNIPKDNIKVFKYYEEGEKGG